MITDLLKEAEEFIRTCYRELNKTEQEVEHRLNELNEHSHTVTSGLSGLGEFLNF